MASIHRLPHSKYFYASFRAGGRQHLRSTKQTDRTKALSVAIQYEKAAKLADAGTLTEAQARDVLNDLLKLTNSGEELRTPSIDAFLTQWLETKEAARSASTGTRYRQIIEEFIEHLDDRAKRSLSALIPADIQNFLTKRQRAGCSPTTVNLDGKIIRTALNSARRQGLLTHNPAESVELPAIETIERGTFTSAEVKLLVDAAEDAEWKNLILLGYFTGARLIDCCRMTWTGDRAKGKLREGVDLTLGLLVYWNHKRKKLVPVPLHPELQEHLEKIASSDSPSAYISPHMAGLRTGGRHGLSEGFKRIVVKAGVDLQTVQGKKKKKISKRTFHALRHTFTSGLANANVPPERRMVLTGHTSEPIHQRYSHHELDVLRQDVAKLPGLGSVQSSKGKRAR